EWINPNNDLTLFYNITRANAAVVVLARNSELYQLLGAMRELEDRWNKKYNYPYVFLNDHMWSYPSWINQTKAAESRAEMEANSIIYGGSESYRHMCRFNSGFFFQHPLLLPFDYYWRLEPSVNFMCDIDYDPFLFMQKNKLVYGFTISLLEYQSTIPTLWDAVKQFIKEYPHHISENNTMKFISNDHGSTYNLCHFWSNFEIGDLNFWRTNQYQDFFNYLDKSGGFFYERWGDAPVHSIAVALFAQKSQVHFFNDIAYYHAPFQHCPTEKEYHDSGRCHCDPEQNFGIVLLI
ncbi:10208_t:CDS:2, partial [Scutellospora calospora]